MAEILADRVNQGLALAVQQVAQRLEPLLALGGWGHRVGGVGCALGFEQGLKFVQGLL
ncbi:hypothetical protein D3C86_2186470 [compost metagenome]